MEAIFILSVMFINNDELALAEIQKLRMKVHERNIGKADAVTFIHFHQLNARK